MSHVTATQMTHSYTFLSIQIRKFRKKYQFLRHALKPVFNIVVDRFKKFLKLSCLTCLIMFRGMKKTTKNAKIMKVTHSPIKISMKIVFISVYAFYSSTVVYGGNILSFHCLEALMVSLKHNIFTA